MIPRPARWLGGFHGASGKTALRERRAVKTGLRERRRLHAAPPHPLPNRLKYIYIFGH